VAEFETLAGGARRIKANTCSFLFSRLEPGVFYTAIEGVDDGEVKLSPLDEISAEHQRFGKPLAWFIDAEKTTNIAAEVFQIWTAWFSRNRHLFSCVHVLAPNKSVHLSVSIAQHLSRTNTVMHVHKDRKPFDAALAKYTKRPYIKTQWQDAEAVQITERDQADGTSTLSCNMSTFSLRRLADDIVFSTITGNDDGSLGNLPFDMVLSALAGSARRTSWFIDASQVRTVSPQVVESWITWVQSHKDDLQTVVLLTPTGLIPMGIEIARERLRAHPIISTCQTMDDFQAKLESRLNAFSYRPVHGQVVNG